MRFSLLLLALVSIVTSLRAQPAKACPCDSATIILTGEVDYRPLPAGLAIEGTDQPEAFAVQASGREFEAIVPGLKAGRYQIEIDAAETTEHAESRRRMDVSCGSVALARDFDVFQHAGGFARACRIQGAVDYAGPWEGGPLTIRFEGRTGEAVFNAIRVKDAAGGMVAAITAAQMREIEPPTAWRVPIVPEAPWYTDPAQPVEKRIDDLVRRMSLGEKITQLLNAAPPVRRLGIPAYDYWNECLHGVARAGIATVFPQAIGLAAMWDPARLHAVAEATGTEARAKHHDAVRQGNRARYYGLTFWTPNINLVRDPRWGRAQETYGEDPFLTGRMAVAFITGLQGDDPRYARALACAKHFAVHSGPDTLRHTFNALPSEQDLYDSYLPHFEQAVREGHVGAVMSAYNRVLGQSATASPFLLTELLRRQWGFQGHVVSDCDAVGDIWRTHHLAATPEEAAAMAVKAGCDLNCGDQYYALAHAVRKGLLTEADVDRALRRVLGARFRLGMFDPDALVPYAGIPMSEVDSPAHAALALAAAQESIVLLKNDGVLPLRREGLKRLAVVGANADSVRVLLGNYNGTPSHPVTILAGLQAAVGPGVEVVFSEGCPLALRPGEPATADAPAFQAAVAAARGADAVIYVGGISPQLEGEEMRVDFDGFAGGDRTRVELPAQQTALLQALHATGRPVIMVNCSGSAVAMPWEAEHLPAMLQAWYPGEAGGTAVAKVIFGDTNPSGRLPITVYRATTDLPPFDDYAMRGRTYRFFAGQPLFAFGHGLSYTKFVYGPVKLERTRVAADGVIHLSVEVGNTGARDGDEVVQVYARRGGAADPKLPRQRLCAFQRLAVPQGQHAIAVFDVPVATLRRWDAPTKRYRVDAGTYELLIGASSADIRSTVVVRVLR